MTILYLVVADHAKICNWWQVLLSSFPYFMSHFHENAEQTAGINDPKIDIQHSLLANAMHASWDWVFYFVSTVISNSHSWWFVFLNYSYSTSLSLIPSFLEVFPLNGNSCCYYSDTWRAAQYAIQCTRYCTALTTDSIRSHGKLIAKQIIIFHLTDKQTQFVLSNFNSHHWFTIDIIQWTVEFDPTILRTIAFLCDW